ncbi:hypothetical protein B0H66DRAFT_179839 [Apodospora peruviana]|uniref:Uncharacterized protein n=1 Tax=Apodospora peruviana TaxID=516989 RepID=A0AAE0IB45_9PEZI|nr:hypothetical protein B0H66DRAFT_179839 [Apodospora peruviana]
MHRERELQLGGTTRAVIDKRIVQPGRIEIQWAEFGLWARDNTDTSESRVVRRLRYDMWYAVAEVLRYVNNGNCSALGNSYGDFSGAVTILANSSLPIVTEYDDGSLSLFRNWADAILYSEDAGPQEGVSAYVRAVMAGWAPELVLDSYGFKLGHADVGFDLFGDEDTTDTEQRFNGRGSETMPPYPYFHGYRASGRTGSYVSVSAVFVALGAIALLTFLLKIWVGPPALTSWMGQHVFLASVGAVGRNGRDELSSGYRVASSQQGMLRSIPGEACKWRWLAVQLHDLIISGRLLYEM